MRRSLIGLLMILGVGALPAPALAIVGGTDAPAGKYPSVANVTINGAFGCTGTLIAPQWVISAGHCSSLTGALGFASPIGNPPSSFQVVLGTNQASGAGGENATVDRVAIPSGYLFTQGTDVSLLHLAAPAKSAPTPVAGNGYGGLFATGVLTEIAGFGVTSDGGAAPATLQQVRIPIVPDSSCTATYGSSYEPGTQLCAGYAEGGRDTCQGDSGGPMFSRTVGGLLLLVGATSYGNGCAMPNTPGSYARVGDATLRAFIAANAPEAIHNAAPGEDVRPAETYDAATKAVVTTAPATGASTAAAAGASPTIVPRFTASLSADRTRRATFRAKGLRFRLRCSAACTAKVALAADAATARALRRSGRTVGTATVKRTASGTTTVALKLSKALAERVTKRHAAKLRLSATVTPKTGAKLTLTRTVTLTGT